MREGLEAVTAGDRWESVGVGPQPAGLRTVRIAAVADLHCPKTAAPGAFQAFFAQVAERADVLVLGGDLTDSGLPEEARNLARDLAAAKVPVVAVLGNHDYESDQPGEVKRILTESGVSVLDGEGCEIKGVGFAGVKGFAGGFGERALQSWGEPSIKAFVREAVEEALKLEAALARLRTRHRVAVMHYAPIAATVAPEPPEIFPFLGSSRLEEPINRYNVTAVFHGHAHRGRPEGRTSAGVPVYNVALPLLRRTSAGEPLFKLLELTVQASPSDGLEATTATPAVHAAAP